MRGPAEQTMGAGGTRPTPVEHPPLKIRYAVVEAVERLDDQHHAEQLVQHDLIQHHLHPRKQSDVN
jgi:hypothetical protein